MSTVVSSARRCVPALAVTRYRLADLGAHTDGAPFIPTAINDDGEIAVAVHCRRPAGLVRGFGLCAGGTVAAGIAFGHAPAASVSRNRMFAGATGTGPKALRAWASHLGTFGERLWPDCSSAARGINSAGDLVGNVLFDAGEFALSRAFWLTTAGSVRFLTPPLGGTTIATALNDDAHVAFNSAPLGAEPGQTHAWCFRRERYTMLGSLGGGRAWAHGLAPGGAITGHSLNDGGCVHAFLWEDGRMHDLGAPDGCMSEGLAVNDAHTVAGRCVHPHAGRRAFVWTPTHGFNLLDEVVAAEPGWELHDAVGVNRHGVIVGIGAHHGFRRGFLLTPVSR